MNYYENKVLQDRESHLIGAGISFILMAPLFGIVAGAFLFVLFGIMAIGGGIKEKVDRKHNQSS